MAALLAGAGVSAQDITGQWNGLLKVQGTQLRLVFHVVKTAGGYTSTMDSPDQGAKGIPVTSTSFENGILKFLVTAIGLNYEGRLTGDSVFTGTFKQGGLTVPLELSRKPAEKEKLQRPQEPMPPYPYYSEDIVFENRTAGIKLAGTLTMPSKEGNFPVVILISGSGPQNRNEELLGHKPFLVLSDFLTRNGIAVLRFDDRGIAASQGDFSTATTADFATDVEAATQYLLTRKEINKNKIGLVGHSEGGIIAPMVAAGSKNIAFIVLMAGTGIPGDELLLMQQAAIAKASGMPDTSIAKYAGINKKVFGMVKTITDTARLKNEVTTYLTTLAAADSNKPAGMSEASYVNMQVRKIVNPWMTWFIKYDPATALKKVHCPVLAINGDKDLQVPSKANLPAIKNALETGGNKNVTTLELPGLNHLFQECKTGSPDEYAFIEQTISPLALNALLQWINGQVK